MVAELLRLRARLLANAFRRPAGAAFGLVVALLAAVAAILALWAAAPVLRTQDDDFVLRFVVTFGSLLTTAAFLVPLIAVRTSTLHPRAFRGYGIRVPLIVAILLLFALLGPLLLMLPIAYLPTTAWPDAASREIAQVAAPIIFVTALFSALVGQWIGIALRRHPHTSALVRTLGVLVLIGWAFVVIVIAAQRLPGMLWLVKLMGSFSFFRRFPEALAESPVGMLWAAPWHASTTGGQPDTAWTLVWAGVALAALLLLIWITIVSWQLRATHRLAVTRRTLSTGWFGRLPSTPTGAIAARSFSYWLRDPRYRTIFGLLPLLPVLILTAFWIGGVPFPVAVLVPLPIMVLVLAWSTAHNDVAFDSTAVWSHLAAGARGMQDRVGRTVPILVFGALLLGIGIPLTAIGYGSFSVVPPLLGVCLALLLGGIGVSHIASVRFPYPAPRPGDGAFQQPQVAGGQGAAAQSFTVLAIAIVALPALVSSGIWLTEGGAWGWIALAIGAVSGLLVLILGTRGSAESFDRRGPELLAFTVRN